ncbi:MAG: nucleotidyltransferase [Thermoplasmata archaeon]|nr:nucleotidyltransferase [Thermoplasmata archaeon]
MDAIETLKRHRGDVDAFGVHRIGVFGSHARGKEHETSDVDVLVEFNEATFDNFMDLIFYLEDLFGRDVDLVTINALSPYIESIVRREVVWCE